ncbi:MAG: hypothetical protein ICV60_21575 [Pyrinomonadaceae bacterium]|nr:hypothetical protein [Pyrinomonadaceae bacterium]
MGDKKSHASVDEKTNRARARPLPEDNALAKAEHDTGNGNSKAAGEEIF